MTHVVLIGADRSAVDALHHAGHDVTLLYEAWEADKVAPLRSSLRHCCAVDLFGSIESLWSALHHLGALADPIGAVVANSETAVVSGAILGQMLGARAVPPAVALRCRDKAVQKAAWRAAGVPTAKSVVIPDALADPDRVVASITKAALKGPFVVKPVAGYGTRGVRLAQDEGALIQIVRESAAANPSMRRLMIEDRIEGDEWHFDGVVLEGSLHTLHVSQYVTPLIETKKGKPNASISFPPGSHPDLYAAAGELTSRALSALGHERGVFHFETFAKPGTFDFVAGELGARVGGNYIPEMIRRTVGIDLWVAAAFAILGEAIPRVPISSKGVFGVTALPASAGRPNRVRTEDIAGIPGVLQVVPVIPFGAVMGDMAESSTTCVGIALVEGTTYDACKATIAAVTGAVLQINEPKGEITS